MKVNDDRETDSMTITLRDSPSVMVQYMRATTYDLASSPISGRMVGSFGSRYWERQTPLKTRATSK